MNHVTFGEQKPNQSFLNFLLKKLLRFSEQYFIFECCACAEFAPLKLAWPTVSVSIDDWFW